MPIKRLAYQRLDYGPAASVNYLYERNHKRDLRLESAQKATSIALSANGAAEAVEVRFRQGHRFLRQAQRTLGIGPGPRSPMSHAAGDDYGQMPNEALH